MLLTKPYKILPFSKRQNKPKSNTETELVVCSMLILGFHMTSLKFKLKNYWFSWVFTFMVHKSSWKLVFIQIRSEWVLGFVIDFAWISKLLRDAAFTWRLRELSCWLKKLLISGNLAISTVHVSEKVLF